MSPRQLVDASVLGGLFLALLIVVLTDKVLPPPESADTPAVVTSTQPEKVIVVKPVVETKPLRLAVTPSYDDGKGPWDDMAKLLRTLGEGYKFDLVEVKELYSAKKFSEFDVLFLTCAPGGDDPVLTANLRNFVGEGGTLYASDWRFDCVAGAFPDLVSRRLTSLGAHQTVSARVVDPGLQDILGKTVPLKFDLNKWKPAAFAGDRVKVLIEGTYQRETGGMTTGPLLVKFTFGKGTVIFTSFHNEKQNSTIEQQLLKYLVFSAVTAQIEQQVNQTLIQGGFKAQKQNLLSASPGNLESSYVWRGTKAGKVRFVLGFDDRGAKLRLSVTTPEGKKLEQEGTSTFAIETAATGPAEWRYTVTALNLPFADFPFTMTVAESE